jgi:hypothetical protein
MYMFIHILIGEDKTVTVSDWKCQRIVASIKGAYMCIYLSIYLFIYVYHMKAQRWQGKKRKGGRHSKSRISFMNHESHL